MSQLLIIAVGNLGFIAGWGARSVSGANEHAAVAAGFQPDFGAEKVVEDDTWFTQHVVAIGNRIVITVKHRITTDFVDEKSTFTSGRLALQQWAPSRTALGPAISSTSTLRFRPTKSISTFPIA